MLQLLEGPDGKVSRGAPSLVSSRLKTVEKLLTMLALVATSSLASSQPTSQGTPIDSIATLNDQVLAALNLVRTDPNGFVESLRIYRGFFHGKIVRVPGYLADYATEEGVAAVDDAMMFVGRQSPVMPLKKSAIFARSAADLAAQQARTGQVGHRGEHGSSPGDRAKRYGGGLQVAEVITYGSVDARDVVRQLVVDDGVPDRGHRPIIFASELHYAGVSCGRHPKFVTMCVIDLGRNASGIPSNTLRVIIKTVQRP